MSGYGDDAGFAARLTALGRTLPGTAASPAVLREIGSAYIDGTYGYRFPGGPTGGAAQERAWPRTGAFDYYGNSIDPSVVPVAVINASYEAAWIEANSPGSLSVTISSAERVKRLKAGSAEIEYTDSPGSISQSVTPMSTTIEGLLFTLIGPAMALPGVLIV